jgi:hypothetical protein
VNAVPTVNVPLLSLWASKKSKVVLDNIRQIKDQGSRIKETGIPSLLYVSERLLTPGLL